MIPISHVGTRFGIKLQGNWEEHAVNFKIFDMFTKKQIKIRNQFCIDKNVNSLFTEISNNFWNCKIISQMMKILL